jgi:hypothetical protein
MELSCLGQFCGHSPPQQSLGVMQRALTRLQLLNLHILPSMSAVWGVLEDLKWLLYTCLGAKRLTALETPPDAVYLIQITKWWSATPLSLTSMIGSVCVFPWYNLTVAEAPASFNAAENIRLRCTEITRPALQPSPGERPCIVLPPKQDVRASCAIARRNMLL